MENNVLKWYGHIHKENNRWPQQTMTWSPGRRMMHSKLGKGMESVMKQKNLTTDDAINWQLWQKAIENH
jgi:hypothetical protein